MKRTVSPEPKPRTAAERLAELRALVETAAPAELRVGYARRLWTQHALCVLCARAVRVAARGWPSGRDPRIGTTHWMPWRAVWSRWMTAAATMRALAKWHVAATHTARPRKAQ